eukprot:TRINITY_DN2871_c0_g1_i2.p1 TRINITY_DN2871_c0_g1~~TRINITY_DN2871_c0_g1_i2.p1  ORF type:complete len:247 (-),score=43.77 TRINITY_DN2871_c0_g1_i2:91-801(-)
MSRSTCSHSDTFDFVILSDDDFSEDLMAWSDLDSDDSYEYIKNSEESDELATGKLNTYFDSEFLNGYIDEDDYEIIDDIYSDEDSPTEFTLWPFWFGCEDDDQLKVIANEYKGFLGVGGLGRGVFEVFVGRIIRYAVGSESDLFTSLDTVDVYRYDAGCPLGGSMTLVSSHYLVTTWEEGIPIRYFDVTEKEDMREFWYARIIPNSVSYIHILPIIFYCKKVLFFMLPRMILSCSC